jgi:tetratricopeptide (TPR) repeat protein
MDKSAPRSSIPSRRNQAMSLLGLLIASAFTMGPATAANRFAKLEEEAQRYFNAGKIHEMRSILQPVARSSDVSPNLLFLYAESYLNDTDFDDKGSTESEMALKRSIQIDPNFAAAYRALAKLYNINGDYQSAIKYATLSLNCKPPNYSAYRQRAAAYDKLHKYNEALADIDACIKQDPLEYNNYIAKGGILENLGRWDDAAAAYHDALKSRKKEEPYFLIAQCYQKAHKLPLALSTLSEVIRRNPEDAEAFEARAKILIEQKKLTEALKDFNESIKLEPNSRVYKERAQLFDTLGRKAEAAKDRASADKEIGGF